MSSFASDLTEHELFQLLSRSEGHLVDFKRAHLPITLPQKERDRKRGEWIKDILAFANTRRTHSAYLIVGVTDDRRVVGIPESRDDAQFQMMVHGKTNRRPLFRYYEILVQGVTRVGIFEIPAEQPRPVYLKQAYGPLSECVVYIRQGSTNAALEPELWRELYPVPPSAHASPKGDVGQLIERWIGLFQSHGVKHHQIPGLLPEHYLPLPALSDWSQTATLLNERLLDDTCRLFNVRRDWLEGDEEQIYYGIPLIYDVQGLLRVLEDWIPMSTDVAMLGFREHRQPLEVHRHQRCGFMLRATIREFGDKAVFKYQPLYVPFDWDYDKGRTIAKIAWLAARIVGCSFWGWVLPREEISTLCGGHIMPDTVLKTPWSGLWHPDDFTYPSSESAVAKEVKEYSHIVEMARRGRVIAQALAIRKRKPSTVGDDFRSKWSRGRSDYVDGKEDDRDQML